MAPRPRGGPPPRRRPPWWPEDEPWPPAGRGGPWGRHGGRGYFVGRFGCLLLGLLVFGSIGVLALWLLVGAVELLAPGVAVGPLAELAPVAGVIVLIVGALAIASSGRWLRRTGAVLDELVAAVSRVETGDYSVRVPAPARGPRPLAALVRGFNTMVERLEADERQRRSLLADVSHELRTPLTVLQGNLEAIADGVHAPDSDRLAALLEETRVLARLVDDLRTVALSEAGTLPLHPEPLDPDVLAAEIVGSFRPAAERAGVELTLDAPDDLPLVDADPVRIREVLSNLVSNALRYTPRGGRVTVRVAHDAERRRLEVAVADTGPGIDPRILPHLFERFVKGTDSRGSGLGLAIARNLVVAHGGGIHATRSTPAGTTIGFWLPLPPPHR